MSEEELARHALSELRRCFHCGRSLVPGWIPRGYEVGDALTVIALCVECEAAIPAGSAAEEVLRRRVEQFRAPDDATVLFHSAMTDA